MAGKRALQYFGAEERLLFSFSFLVFVVWGGFTFQFRNAEHARRHPIGNAF